ncbi:BnaC07g31630D [Brassica napus]|uniref:BnaC07g31630D protein n=2 Tax=Brassica napus TaxID=3708 RepID=A0A078GCJ7_BRANA|nr:BnaC07g31630D [Brassica napus]
MLSKDYPLPESCSIGTELLGLRKKKVTDEWRRFRQPLMWRCKWLELKVKEIESQARGYDKEIQSYYQSKQFDLEKSKPCYGDDQTQRKSVVFKRGRRRRVEETTDVSAYISNHNVFSYAEKRKPTTLKPQCPVPGRKEDESEDDCFVCEKKRVDELMMMCKSHTSSMPRTIARSRSDIPQAPPPFEVDGQFLFNNSPNPYGGLRFPTIEDMLMDGDEYEGEPDKDELDHCFMKLMNEFGEETIMSEEEEEDNDVIPPH